MTTGTRRSTRRHHLLLVVLVTLLVAAAGGAVLTRPAMAADGPQPAPTLTPSPVPGATDTFTLGSGSCDGTGGAGWRVQTFIVNGDVDISTLVFDQGPFFDRVGSDRDSSDGSIRSPLWKGGAPGTGYNPAASPAGLINPADLSAFDFSSAGWVLTDGEYQIGYACLDELTALRQWWSLPVTIDADAAPNPFMSISEDTGPEATSIALSATPATSTVGGSVTFTASVTPSGAAGSVEFFLGGASQATVLVASGNATWTTSALTAGTKSITATFTPTDATAFNASTSPPLSHVVSGAAAQATSVALAAEPASQAVEGQLVTLTATVTPSGAAGAVTFSADGDPLGAATALAGGVATLATTALVEGSVSLTAAFVPTDPQAFAGSTGTLAYTVVTSSGEATAVTLVSDPADQAAVGQEVAFTATVEPDAPGTMTFVEEGQILGGPVDVTDGVATYATSDLAEGVHSIVAAFTPTDSDAFQPSSSDPLALTVGEGPPPPDPIPTTDGTTDGFTEVAGSGTGTLPLTGVSVGVAGLGLVLVYLGRVLYLVSRPRSFTARR